MSTTQTVLDHHLQCFGTCDLEGILADYAPDAVILTADGAVRGLPAIRGYFAEAFAEFGRAGTTFAMRMVLVEGDCAFIVWDAETVDTRFESASDTFLVRDGRIVVQTYAAKVTAKARAQTSAADGRQRRETESVV